MPAMNGTFGCLRFDINTRIPRHFHMKVATDAKSRRYVVENILVLNGVAIVELSGEIYVEPPKTLVSIGGGMPHTWTACLARICKNLVYRPTSNRVRWSISGIFLPIRQSQLLMHEEDYEDCDDLHSVRIPKYKIDDSIMNAWFVWGKCDRKSCDIRS
ncbi:uncharacterized protein EAE98_010239 [Botrytis deweyae]|uniref:Uncharacterized protein n=1 Tax=Botrytis deweyae TaxID=2478750 RepID=A0ABQ7I9I6_9HELO|nr:uncharacterized protein EAE98_010239 [Botrytis deweyae]KAF7917476.1 hypothetical protein EAE98_010239 [Botrytis deweyae]